MTLELVPDAPHLMVDSLRAMFTACESAGIPKFYVLHTPKIDNLSAPVDATGDPSSLLAGTSLSFPQSSLYVAVDYAENQKSIDLRNASLVLVSLVSSDPFKPTTLGYGHVAKRTRLQIDIRCGDNADPNAALGETNWSTGTFTAGSTTTLLKDTVKFDTANNAWLNYWIYIVGTLSGGAWVGNNRGLVRRITASTQSSKTVTVAALDAAPATGDYYIIGPYEFTGRHRLVQLVSQIRNGLMAIRNLWDDTNGGSPTGYNKFGSNYLWLEIANPEAAPEKEVNAWRYIMEVDLIHPFQAVPEGGIQDATN